MEVKNTRISLLASLMGAASLAFLANSPIQAPQRSLRGYFRPAGAPRSRSKRYPQMVTSSDAEIAEWNRNVNTRQVRRSAS